MEENLMRRIGKKGFMGKCSCGRTHKFKASEINLHQDYIQLESPYKCYCKNEFVGIEKENGNKFYKMPLYLMGTIATICILLVGGFIFNAINSAIHSPDYYPKDPKDLTNKQYQELKKIDEKMKKKEWENQKVNSDNVKF